MSKLYFCVGCRQVHYDDDYSEKDGDLLIEDWNSFLESIRHIDAVIKKKRMEKKQ